MPDAPIDLLLDHLKRSRGFDFTGYRRGSLERRIHKRMQAVGAQSYEDYVDHLQVHPDEFPVLFDTILINVTGFFRDAPAWEYLSAEIIPRLLEAIPPGAPIRVWCAGCASGEEAYTLVMALAEAMGEEQYLARVKVYATDVDEDALGEARHASYSAKDVETIPLHTRERYFTRVDQRHVLRRDLRRTVIFGRNDLVQDAPISHIDLLLCRNTLMYFNAEIQARILDRFSFALNDWGYLYVGRSEMLITYSDLFRPVSLKRRVFAKVGRPALRDRLVLSAQGLRAAQAAGDGADALRETAFDAAPSPQIVIDEEGILVLANQRARALFRLTPSDLGRPLEDLEVSYRPLELRPHVELVHAERHGTVRATSVPAASDDVRELEVHISPMYSGERTLGTSVVYEDVTVARRLQQDLEDSRRELERSHQELQSTVEELETTNEELETTNEELETINDELQSGNEELETINEELQSGNEELETINEELRQRTLELNDINSLLETMLVSMGMAVAVVDADLTVRVWNADSRELWGLHGDEAAGRHLLGLALGLPVERLEAPLRQVLSGAEPRNEVVMEATNRRGRAIECRVTCLPLMGADGITGAIVLMEDLGAEVASPVVAAG